MSKISREAAKELVDEADGGVLTVLSVDPVPSIGEVDEQELQVTSSVFRFGDTVDETVDADSGQ